MKSKLIPSSFTLGGSNIDVVFTDSKMGKEVGQLNFVICKIFVAKEFNGYKCTGDYMETTFYHELVHGILDSMGRHTLSEDEEFVEGFANLLHQYEKTKK